MKVGRPVGSEAEYRYQVSLSIKTTDAMRARLKRVSDARGVSVTVVVNEILVGVIEDVERAAGLLEDE